MTTTKNTPKKDLQRAEELMRIHVQSIANKKALFDTIRNEIEAYDKNIKETAAELIEIGERNRDKFNTDGNLDLQEGYLHVANNAVIVTGRKFDVATFNEAHPELIDIKLKTGAVKKAFQDKATRKELISLGVQVDNEETLQVIAKPLGKEA